MTVSEVVGEIAKKRIVETIVWKVTESGATAYDPDSLNDLIQDVYLSLLEDKNIVEAYKEHHEKFYIARIIMNNIASSSSRYYRTYIMPLKKGVSINEGIGIDGDD